MNLGNIKSLMNDFLAKPAEQLNRYIVDNATKDVTSIIQYGNEHLFADKMERKDEKTSVPQ